MSEPRIVYFDLETIPDLRQALKVWPQLSNFPGRTLKASITSLLCFGYSIGTEEPKVLNQWDFSSRVNDDFALVSAAHSILQEADCVITHNGKRFDWKYIQTRFLVHGLPPLPKIIHEDTKSLASSNLFCFSNSLDYLNMIFGLTRKLDHEGWELWEKCWEGDPDARALMSKYCGQDVLALQELFRRLRPFARNFPNRNLFFPGKTKVCPACESTRLVKYGYQITRTRKYQRYQCQDCGFISRTDARDELPR